MTADFDVTINPAEEGLTTEQVAAGISGYDALITGWNSAPLLTSEVFEKADKLRIIANARDALRPGGSLWILDYDEFDLERTRQPIRWLFTHFECELASEFLRLDLAALLSGSGFGQFATHQLMYGTVRLLKAVKQPGQ